MIRTAEKNWPKRITTPIPLFPSFSYTVPASDAKQSLHRMLNSSCIRCYTVPASDAIQSLHWILYSPYTGCYTFPAFDVIQFQHWVPYSPCIRCYTVPAWGDTSYGLRIWCYLIQFLHWVLPHQGFWNDSWAGVCETWVDYIPASSLYHSLNGREKWTTALSLKHRRSQASSFQQCPSRIRKQNQPFLSWMHHGHQSIRIVLSRSNTC